MTITGISSSQQTTPASKGLGVQKSPLKVSSSSQKANSAALNLTQQLDQLSLSEVRTKYLGPNGQLPPVAKAGQKSLPNPTQDFKKKLLGGENRSLKKQTSDPTQERDKHLTTLRAIASKSDIQPQGKPKQPIAEALEEALKFITEDRQKVEPGQSPLLTPTKENLKCTIALRDLLQESGKLSFTKHAYARTLLRGEAITCLKASEEFLNNAKDSKTCLVFDRGRNELATQENELATQETDEPIPYNQVVLMRDNSATKKKVLIPLAPDPNQLVAKSVIAKQTVNPGRYVVVTDHSGKPITTVKQYQDELKHIQELSSCSKKLFQ